MCIRDRLHAAAGRLVALLNDWDDAVAAKLFADNVALDESFARRAAAAAKVRELHGPLELEAVAPDGRASGGEALVIPCDVSELDVLDNLVDRTVEAFGGVDVVVNNAGGSMPNAFLDTSVRAFEKAFHFNVTTAFRLTQLAVPHMLDREGASVVNISSAIGRMSDRGFAAYGTAKGALTHLTRLLAADLAPRVRVNGIAVGSVATSALQVVLDSDEIHDEMVARTPLKRLGDPTDIAAAAVAIGEAFQEPEAEIER